jgi:hypothetical protein
MQLPQDRVPGFPKNQVKSIRTSNAIKQLREEFKGRIKTPTISLSAETAAGFGPDHDTQGLRVAKPSRKAIAA